MAKSYTYIVKGCVMDVCMYVPYDVYMHHVVGRCTVPYICIQYLFIGLQTVVWQCCVLHVISNAYVFIALRRYYMDH